MGVSDITVAALATTPGIGYIDLTWTYSDPRSGAIPNIALDSVEVWGATTNDRSLAAKVAEGITSARHSGIANGATWYYWIKPRNKINNYGAFHPVSATAGVSGTEATATQVTLSALTAVVNVSQASLQWVITDPSSNGLGYLGLAAVEVWAASTNDRAGAAKVTEGLTSAVHDAIPEGETRYYWIRPRNRNGTFGSFFPSSATAGVIATVRDQVGLAFGLSNGKLVTTVGSNALTIALKTTAGADASATDKIFLAFRNTTLTTGDYQIRQITAALSLVISSGSTLGATNSTPFRVWIVLFDDGGTLRLGAINCSTSSAIYPLAEFGVRSSTAEGGAGAADSAGVVYTGTAVTSKPFRILGYLDWNSGLGTAGTWSATPDVIQLFSPGMKKPGDLVQRNISSLSTTQEGSTVIPFDGTVPQNTEGDQYFSTAITPTSPVNLIENEYKLRCSNNSPDGLANAAALFKDSAAGAIDVAWGYLFNVNVPITLDSKHLMRAGTTSQITYKIRAGGGGSTGPLGTDFILNGASPDSGATLTNYYGGVMISFHSVSEIMG